MNRGRALTSVLVLLAAWLLFPLPAAAAHKHQTGDSTDITPIRDQALADMAATVGALESALAGASSDAEVDAAKDLALAEIDRVWSAARQAIQDAGASGSAGGEARQTLQEARQGHRADIEALAAAWAPPTSTTTAPPPTTTTTNSPAPAAGSPPGNDGANGKTKPNENGSNPPGPGGENGSPGKAQREGYGPGGQDPVPQTPDSASPDESGASGTVNRDGVGVAAGPTDPGPALVHDPGQEMTVAPLPKDFLVSSSPEVVMKGPDARGPATSIGDGAPMPSMALTPLLDNVLPPALVDLVLSPLVILEILTMTTLEDTQRVLGPLALLMMAGGLVWLGDRVTRRGVAASGQATTRDGS